jgi:hypothetical protein
VQRLAEKVYELLMAEARLGHSRTDSTPYRQRSTED